MTSATRARSYDLVGHHTRFTLIILNVSIRVSLAYLLYHLSLVTHCFWLFLSFSWDSFFFFFALHSKASEFALSRNCWQIGESYQGWMSSTLLLANFWDCWFLLRLLLFFKCVWLCKVVLRVHGPRFHTSSLAKWLPALSGLQIPVLNHNQVKQLFHGGKQQARNRRQSDWS